ncbi:MAG: hypothetical protein ACYTFK_12995 [Planctomycetota bacterium]
MPDSNLYLKEAVDRLIEGLATLTDSDGDNIVIETQAFIEPYPTGSDWAAANPFRLSRQEQPQGSPTIEQTWDVPIKIGIGNVGMEYGGIQQEKLWERIPIVVNWITEHPHLQFAQATSLLTYLDTTIGVKVAPGSVQAIPEDQETGKLLWFNITVQIPFRIPMNIVKYQDGQLIEV